jgi:hypothetical protein
MLDQNVVQARLLTYGGAQSHRARKSVDCARSPTLDCHPTELERELDTANKINLQRKSEAKPLFE